MKQREWSRGLLVLALCAGLVGCGQKKPEELVKQAQEALAQDDWKTAQIHLKNALTQLPDDAQIRFLLGETLLNAGDPTNALVEFSKAEQGQFDANRLVPLQAKALLQTRKAREVLQQFGSRQLTDPQAQAALLVVLAQAHATGGQMAEARTAIEQALRAVPDHPKALLMQARMAGGERRLDEALALVERVIANSPRDSEAWRLKGDLLVGGKNDAAGGRSAFEKAVEVSPRDLAAHQSLIGFLVSQKETQAAKDRLEAARKVFGDNTTVRFYAAHLALGDGKLDEAKTHIEQLLKFSGDDPRVLYLAGQIAYQRGEDLVAESHLSKLLTLPGDNGRVRLLLAATQLRMADPSKALRTLEPLLEDSAQRVAQVFALAGDAHAQLGQSAQAQAMYARAAQLDPQDARSRTMVALGRVAGGEEAQGLDQLRDLAAQTDSPIADVALVGSLIRKGDHVGAMAALDALEKKQPGRAETMNLRAQAHDAKGDKEQARVAWQEALKRDPKNMAAAVSLAKLDFAAQRGSDAVARFHAVAKADPSNPIPALAALQARQLMGEKPDELVKVAQQLVQQFPKAPRVRVALVRLWQAAGDGDRALSASQEAVAAMPNEAELLEMLGALQLARGDHGQAHKVLSDLVALRPRSAEALVRLAEVDIARKAYRQALGTARKALELQGNHVPALRQVVGLELELGNVSAARKLIKDMESMTLPAGLALVFEGDLEGRQQNWPAAAAAYQKALAAKSNWPGLASKLHRALLTAGKGAEAQAFAQKWLKDKPHDGLFVAYLADSALARSDWAEARTRYEALLAKAPNDPVVMNNLAWVMLRSGQLQGAESWARKAVAARPNSGAMADTLSEILSAEGKHQEAIEWQRKAVSLEGSNPERRVGLAKRLIAAKQRDQAKAELEAVAQLGDRYPNQAEIQALLKQL